MTEQGFMLRQERSGSVVMMLGNGSILSSNSS